MRTLFAAPVAVLTAAVVGCGGGDTPAKPAAPVLAFPDGAAPSAADAVWVESPDYANWKRFKPNITVVRRKVSKNATDSVTEVRTLRLVEVTSGKVTVETQITVERPNTPPLVNPPMTQDLPAKFRLPAGMTADQFLKPSLKAKEAEEETLAVGGKGYKAKVFTWEDSTEAGPQPNKLWVSDAMPGRFVKQQMRVEKTNTSTTEEVVEVRLAE